MVKQAQDPQFDLGLTGKSPEKLGQEAALATEAYSPVR